MPAIPYKYAYLAIVLAFGLPIWLYIFLKRPDLRKQIIFVGLLTGLVAPIWEFWFLTDYWHPETFTGWLVGIEDFSYGFLAAGLISTLYEFIFHRALSLRPLRKHDFSLMIIPFFCLGGISFNLLYLLGINSIYAAFASFAVMAVVILYFRRELILDSLVTGLMFFALTFLVYTVILRVFPQLINRWWYLANLSGIYLANIPVEELLWAFGMGMVVGPFYEFVTGYKLRRSVN